MYIKNIEIPHSFSYFFQLETIGKHQISLTNESQYLLISETSLLEIFKQFKRSKNLIKFDELADSFRANFIINGDLAFEEDNWKEVNIGELHLKVSIIENCVFISAWLTTVRTFP